MRQRWTGARAVVSLAGAALVDVLGLQAWPFPATDPILGLIAVHRPALYRVLLSGYATVWFSTPFVLLQALASLVFIYGRGSRRSALSAALPPYPDPATRDSLFLVLGEQHQRSVPEPAPQPRWLVIPETGLYTGMAIVGAVGTGKTSSCIYPYVEQLLAFRAEYPARKAGGLVLDVKGDFARHVQAILDRHGPGADYIEVSLDGPCRYNPLHNDLEAYALRHWAASYRQLLKNVLHAAAPSDVVKKWDSSDLDSKGFPPRRTKVRWLCRDEVEVQRRFLIEDIDSALGFLKVLDDGVHDDELEINEPDFHWLSLRVEKALHDILRLWRRG